MHKFVADRNNRHNELVETKGLIRSCKAGIRKPEIETDAVLLVEILNNEKSPQSCVADCCIKLLYLQREK